MSSATDPDSAPRGHLHHALLYDSPETLVAAAAPFLAEGLAAGETVVLSCQEEQNALLAEALGNDDRILHRPSVDPDARTASAVAGRRRLVHRQQAGGASRVRMVGQVPIDDRPRMWAKWHRFEAVCNVALRPLPLISVCAYDTRELPDSVRRGVEQTHPLLLTPGGRTRNDRYVDPATVLRQTMATRPDPLQSTEPVLHRAVLTDVRDLPGVRADLRVVLRGLDRHEQRRADFIAAVGEVLSNAFRHGHPPVDLWLWATPTRLVCTVTDHGAGFDDPLAGHIPPADNPPHTGAGLWLARQTCDVLDAYRTPAEFTVRLTTHLVPSAA